MAKLYHCGEYLDTSIKFSDITDLPKINNVEIKGNKNSVNDLKIPGKIKENNGEVFGDYLDNKATGFYSHAEGCRTTASGNDGSHAEGVDTIASGDYSHAEGNASEASGTDSHAEGHSTLANNHSAHAEGRDTEASGDASHAEGYITKATNNYSHSEGSNTTASGSNSHTEGAYTKATSDCSHAEGNSTQATDNCAHAEGLHTIASGYASHAEGRETKAIGLYSHAGGLGTEAHDTAQTSIGMYNNNQTNSLFEVGNGNSSTSKSNAFEVFKDGHINVNGDYYQYGKKVNFGNDYTLPTASATVKGGVKIGSGLQMVGDVLNAISSSSGDTISIKTMVVSPKIPVGYYECIWFDITFNVIEGYRAIAITPRSSRNNNPESEGWIYNDEEFSWHVVDPTGFSNPGGVITIAGGINSKEDHALGMSFMVTCIKGNSEYKYPDAIADGATVKTRYTAKL